LSGGVDVNRPEVVAEVAAAFAQYEDALVANDVTRLAEFFWDSGDVVRFGLSDHQIGAEELHRWRRRQPRLPAGRQLIDPRITTFGTDFAMVTTRFTYSTAGGSGRQSQTWVRLPVGWRVVSAHVSAPTESAPPVLTGAQSG
jgi:ketosteroid isomerase-like protein